MLYFWLLTMVVPAFSFSPEQVLKTAWTDKTYSSQQELRPVNTRNPLRNVEAFTALETEDGKQEYELGLKFQLRSWAEWRWKGTAESSGSVLKEIALSGALYERYLSLITYEISRRKLEALAKSMALAESYLKAQGLSVKAGRSTAKDLMAAQTDLMKLKRQEALVVEEHSRSKAKLSQWVPEGEPEMVDLVTLSEIEESLKEASGSAPSLSGRMVKVELFDINRELEILKARENQWVKEIEVAQGRKESESSYKFKLGFQLPGLGADDLSRQKQNELVLKRALKQKEIDDVGQRQILLKGKIQTLIRLYRLSEKGAPRELRRRADVLQSLEERMMQDQHTVDLLTQQQEILTLYVEYLLESERLLVEPARNYITKGQKMVSL